MRILFGAVVCTFVGASVCSADVIEVVSSRDNTIYSEAANSNGAGPAMFAGTNSGPNNRRALVYFDVAGSLPPGATIVSARLRLYNSSTNAGAATVKVHRLLEDWGEGTSSAGLSSGGGGSGAPATSGDATWANRFHPGSAWATTGGTFAASASASLSVEGSGFFEWIGLGSDVAGFLSTPLSNVGWILIGDESTGSTAKRFSTREESAADRRPTLIVEFIPSPGAAGLIGLAGLVSVRRRR